jgi:trehalose 6-phosphate phosphatase
VVGGSGRGHLVGAATTCHRVAAPVPARSPGSAFFERVPARSRLASGLPCLLPGVWVLGRRQGLAAPAAYWVKIASRLRTTLRAGRTVLFLSDFDGTLSPIVREPSEARLRPAVKEDLRTLAAAPGVVVGIVSGRSLDDLRTRVGLPSLVYGGCHGLEISGPGIAFRHPAAATHSAALAEVAGVLDRSSAGQTGVVVESKGLSLTVHHRSAPPPTARRLAATVEGLMRERKDVTLLRGRKAFEILPACDWDKGRWVRWIEEQVQARIGDGVTTVYLGDDASDEAAFAALRGRGITVKVGGAPGTLASYRFAEIDDVFRLLSALADHVAAVTPADDRSAAPGRG